MLESLLMGRKPLDPNVLIDIDFNRQSVGDTNIVDLGGNTWNRVAGSGTNPVVVADATMGNVMQFNGSGYFTLPMVNRLRLSAKSFLLEIVLKCTNDYTKVFGTGDTGAIPTGVSPNPTRVNQMVRMVKGAWSFIVRVPKGTATPATVTSAVANWANTEVLDIIARLYATTPAVNGKGRFLDVTAPSAVYTNNWYSTSSVAPLSPPDGLGAAAPTSGYPYWVPVLELELL